MPFTQNRKALEAQPIDYEKPGLGQHYCVECAKWVHIHNWIWRVIYRLCFIGTTRRTSPYEHIGEVRFTNGAANS